MKECKYCRTKYDDNLAACPNCGGTKIVTAEELAEEAAIKEREVEYREKANAAAEGHKKRLIGILTAVVVVIIAVIAVISINANKPLSNGMTKDEGEKVLAAGIAYLDNGNYEASIDCFLQLPPDSKQYEEAQSLLAKSVDSYRESILNKVDSYIQSGEYDVALELLKNAQTILPDDTKLNNAYNSTFDFYKSLISDTAIAEADEFAADGDYVSAIKALNAALDKIEQDEELDAKLTIYVNEYVSTVTSTAQAQYKKYNAESIYAAEEIITNALDILPGNQDLTSALDYYQELEPIKIVAMPAADTGHSGGFATMETARDTAGITYSDVVYVENFSFDAHDDDHKWWWYCFKDIDLDFQYSKITGVVFQNEKYASAATQTKIIIQGFPDADSLNYHYFDNRYSLWTGQVSGDSGPKYFDVDVTGKQYVAIQFQGDHSAGSENDAYHYAYLAQLYLWR